MLLNTSLNYNPHKQIFYSIFFYTLPIYRLEQEKLERLGQNSQFGLLFKIICDSQFIFHTFGYIKWILFASNYLLMLFVCLDLLSQFKTWLLRRRSSKNGRIYACSHSKSLKWVIYRRFVGSWLLIGCLILLSSFLQSRCGWKDLVVVCSAIPASLLAWNKQIWVVLCRTCSSRRKIVGSVTLPLTRIHLLLLFFSDKTGCVMISRRVIWISSLLHRTQIFQICPSFIILTSTIILSLILISLPLRVMIQRSCRGLFKTLLASCWIISFSHRLSNDTTWDYAAKGRVDDA